MHPGWLSNTWLVAEGTGGHGVLVDSGGPEGPILERIRELDLTVTRVLCTHHHLDHVCNNGIFREELGARICGHEAERSLFRDLDETLAGGEEIHSGGLRIRALHIPGHTLGQLAFLVNDRAIFTGDTLFKGTIGGTRGPGHTTYGDIRRSIMDVLMALPGETTVHPGHMEETTIGEEWETNPFIRIWRGLEPEGTGRCEALGEPATLVLRAGDYDGGTKCWVRFRAGDRDDIVAGSRVRDLPG